MARDTLATVSRIAIALGVVLALFGTAGAAAAAPSSAGVAGVTGDHPDLESVGAASVDGPTTDEWCANEPHWAIHCGTNL